MARLADAAQERIKDLLSDDPNMSMERVYERCRTEGLTTASPETFESFFTPIRDEIHEEIVEVAAQLEVGEEPDELAQAEDTPRRPRRSRPNLDAEPDQEEEGLAGFARDRVTFSLEGQEDETERARRLMSLPGRSANYATLPTDERTLELRTPEGWFKVEVDGSGAHYVCVDARLSQGAADRISAIILQELYDWPSNGNSPA